MSRQGAQKRRKELARQEKQRAKEAARAQRKLDKIAAATDGTGEVIDQPVAEPTPQTSQDP